MSSHHKDHPKGGKRERKNPKSMMNSHVLEQMWEKET